MAPAIGVAEWNQLQCEGDQPRGRTGHTLTMAGQNCVMFGGMTQDAAGTEIDFTSETWVLNMDSNPKWDAPVGWVPTDASKSKEGFVHAPFSTPPGAECPEGRWKHTSVTLDDDHILIFGGLADKNKRFDDVWIFEVSTGTWRNVKHVGTPPCPRAHHTATMVGTKMYVWGGYGGHKQRRAFYNDLYVLETAPYVMPEETDDGTAPSSEYEEGDLVWTKINAGGPMPEPRSNHTCSLIAVPASSDNKMLCVMGGRDHLKFFDDVHFLDLNTKEWTNAEMRPSLPRGLAHHMALAVASVPHYKLFIFGGQQGGDNRGDWKYVQNVNCLDCGDRKSVV